ncbi:zinc metalloproteinase-disintegrin-like crotastatin isoform X2 [Hyla sarda]|uniref:zinc metalloproteinase-disintegrin-like crotastatin isoform X2 n=1 Tax=Hyla sarda TaxID=327740 RepID=UPI0024C38095|nr:zinc metalloproteinase-disintegrin-like crotastatin isoform X2 [Hyla sarda]
MLISALLLLALLDSQLLANNIPEGQSYQVVVPEKIHSQHKRDTQSKYPDLIQYKLHVDGKPIVLHMEKTENLLAEDFTVTRYGDDGSPITTKPQDQDHCCYQGRVKEDDGSTLSICTCKGLSGLIHTRNRRFLIEPLNQTDSGDHAVFETNEETPRTCGVTNTSWTEGKTSKSSRSSNVEKQNFLKSQKYVQVYVVADKTMFTKYNRSSENVKQRIFEMLNYVNEVYKSLNTFVALTGVEIWEKNDQFEVASSASTNLDRFSNWRKNNLLPRKPHDNAQFITHTDFDGSTVGLAFVGTMCSESHSSGVIQDHSKLSISVGATIAHEMGHNLGMNHDSSSCSCTADSCIMAPTLSYNTPYLFSSCSLSNFQEFIYDRMPQCMRDEPSKQFIMSPSVCGNKFTELGEDCDCGTVKECTNPCCDASTCKFKNKAECADGECCENCKIKKAGSVCRPAKDDCDLSDMCTGKSPECPSDRFIYNGRPCNDGQGICYNGQCPMLESQCSQMWGASSAVGEKSCFNVNTRGVNYGHCKKVDGSYVSCQPQDVMCGMLFCFGGNDNPSVYASVASFSRCKAVLDHRGMVLNGTKCGDGQVCSDGRCLSINSAYRSANCSEKCPGHGVCDHELKCQCQEGWAPPHCDVTSDKNIIIIVVVVIIAVLLVVGLILMLVFRKRCIKRSGARVSGATNPGFHHAQVKSIVSTPELSTKIVYPPPPPPEKPKKTQPASRAGYQGPQYSTTTSVEFTKNSPAIQRPTAAPPPVPTSKPVLPTPPPKALKPPVKN